MLVLKKLIANKIVLKNVETLVHNVSEAVRHTADQSKIGSLKINYFYEKNFDKSDSETILPGNNDAKPP